MTTISDYVILRAQGDDAGIGAAVRVALGNGYQPYGPTHFSFNKLENVYEATQVVVKHKLHLNDSCPQSVSDITRLAEPAVSRTNRKLK